MKLPKLPKVSKKVALITAGSLIVLALFIFAVVSQVRQERHDNIVAAQASAQRDNDTAQYKSQISQLKASNKALSDTKTALCANYTALSTARATKAYVIVPTACTR